VLHRLLAPGRLVLLVALVAVASVVAGGLSTSPASAAEHCHYQAVRNPDGTISYVKVCEQVDPGEPGGPGDSGGGPDCGLDKMTPQPGYSAFFCVGTAHCTIKDNWSPYAPPTESAPAGQEWKLRLCWPCGGCLGPPVPTYVLNGPPARPLIVQAQEAFGNLAPPAGKVRHSPQARGIVGLPTWLWLDPGSFGRLQGSSAEGLVAVAEPAGTDWATGDGGSLNCPGAGTPYGTAGPGCTHTYRAAAARYDGTVTRHWQVHYENGGARITIPGAPPALAATTPWTLGVAEAQVVTGGR
jgi:hypothetical protein